MAMKQTLLVLLCVTVNSVHYVRGSKIDFVSSPARILTGLTNHVTLRCEIRDTSASANIVGKRDVTETTDNVEEVTSIILMKGGNDVASVSHFLSAHVMDNSTNVQVTGGVSKATGGNGHLEVTITNPTPAQLGEYVCEANALSQAGHPVKFTESLELEAATPTTADLIQEIVRLKTQVMFSVASTVSETITAGQVVKYNIVMTNVGGAFDVTHNQFVCPVTGYYKFDIHALNSHGQAFWLDLKVNDQIKASIHGAHDDFQSGSNSAVVRVEKGDIVKVVAMATSDLYDTSRQLYTTFNGHLLSVI